MSQAPPSSVDAIALPRLDAIDPALDLEGDPDDDLALVADEATAAGPHRISLTDGRRRSHLHVTAFGSDGRPSVLEHSFIVENECDGWRLDRFLMKRMPRLSRTRIQRVIRGDLDVNGAPETRPGASVRAGATISFRRPAPVEPTVPRTLSVLHTDPFFYALEKPAGLPIHPTARYHYSTLTAVLRERFPDERLEVCHRLDRETSGILLVARTPPDDPSTPPFRPGSLIKQSFARRQVAKTYLAIVHGHVTAPLTIDAPLALAGAASQVRIKMAVIPVAQGGLPSRTRIVPVSHHTSPRGRFTLVAAHPESGRQHQIRVHLAHANHPIVGDKLYPDEHLFIDWADHGDTPALLESLLLPRHALHAHAITFPHPLTNHPTTVTSPLPVDLAEFLRLI